VRGQLTGLVIGGALIAASNAPLAHHSFAMFDQESPIELEGIVQEFRFVAPHAFIILVVKQKDGGTETWILEGVSPSALVREGWSRSSLKPGDQLKVKIAPLRSGAPGGAWTIDKINFRDWKPIMVSP
jgi:hypothetical protein